MKKFFFNLIVCLAGVASAADLKIKQGEYKISNCDVNVRSYNGYFEISVRQGVDEARFNLLPDGRLVQGMGSCNGNSMTQRDDTVFTLKKASQFSVYTAKCGGLSSATDFVGQFILNTATGQIDHVFMDKKIAKYSTGPGVHSGPLKDHYGTVNCSLDGAISANQNLKSRDQIESHLKSSNEKQKMPSFAEIRALPKDRKDPKKEEAKR